MKYLTVCTALGPLKPLIIAIAAWIESQDMARMRTRIEISGWFKRIRILKNHQTSGARAGSNPNRKQPTTKQVRPWVDCNIMCDHLFWIAVFFSQKCYLVLVWPILSSTHQSAIAVDQKTTSSTDHLEVNCIKPNYAMVPDLLDPEDCLQKDGQSGHTAVLHGDVVDHQTLLGVLLQEQGHTVLPELWRLEYQDLEDVWSANNFWITCMRTMTSVTPAFRMVSKSLPRFLLCSRNL